MRAVATGSVFRPRQSCLPALFVPDRLSQNSMFLPTSDSPYYGMANLASTYGALFAGRLDFEIAAEFVAGTHSFEQWLTRKGVLPYRRRPVHRPRPLESWCTSPGRCLSSAGGFRDVGVRSPWTRRQSR